MRRCRPAAWTAFPGATVSDRQHGLPFALARWTAATGVTHAPWRATQRGLRRDYGWGPIKEWRAIAAGPVSWFDGDGSIVHAQYVHDKMQEPELRPAVAARPAQAADPTRLNARRRAQRDCRRWCGGPGRRPPWPAASSLEIGPASVAPEARICPGLTRGMVR